MSIRLSPTAYRTVCGTGSSWCSPSRLGRDPVVERERVPGEPSARPERRGDALERAAAVGPGRQVQERAERAVDQRRRLVEREVAHVALAQVELDARLGRAGVAPARASPARCRCRSPAGRSPARPGSRPARSRPRARPAARPPRGPARRRRRRRPSCGPTTRRSGPRTPRPSSSVSSHHAGPARKAEGEGFEPSMDVNRP